jgi:GNAT superfamily N-acetyltransferase
MDAQRAEAVARTVRAIAEGFDERAGKLQQIIAADENAGLPLDEIADHVREAYTAADTWAGTTSREVVGAMNAASLITATQAGAVRKRWLATDDERTRPTHREAEGQTVHIAEPFRVGGHPLRFPHDPAGPVGETINCRCTMIYQQPERDFDAELDADLADLEAREGEWKARVRTPEGAEHYGQSIGSVIRPDAPDELLARNPSFAAGRASALGLPAPKPAKPKRERTASDEFGRRMTPKLWDAKERADEAGGRPIGKLDKQKGAGATLYDGEFPDGAADFVMSTFDRDDWPGGLVTVVDPYGTYINNGGDTLRVVGEIHDAEGAKVGKFERLVNMEEGRLTNEYLKLKPHVQGQGFAEAFYRHTEESVAAQGITEVAIHANLDVGGYAWAKRGFDWDAEERDPDEIAAMLRMRLSAIDWGEASPEQIAAREEMDRRLRVADTWDDVPSPAEMAAWGQEHQWTGHTRHGVEIPMWPGKAMMLDSAWHGVKPVGRGFEKKAEDPADWNRRVMASLPDAEKQFKPGDYYKPHDRETDLNLLLADLLLPPAEVEEKRRGFASRFARVGGFDPDEHPRDQRGRFLDKPGVVLPGGSRGRAIAVDDSGDVTVEREGGGTTVASADSLIDPEKEQPPPPVLPPPPPKPESVPKPGFEPTAPKRVLAAVEAAKARNPATTGVRALGRDAWVEQMQSDDWLATTARNRIRSFEADNANIRKELDQGFADWRVQDLVIQGHSEEEARRLAAERYPIPADEREWSEAEIVRGEGKIARERELIEANARQWSDQFDRQIAADGREAEGTLIHRDLYAADGGPSDAVMADLDAVIKAGRTVEQEARRRLKATHGKRVVALENQSNEQFDRMQEMEGGLRRAAFTEATGIADYSSWTATMHGYIREFSERGDTERANEARLALARNMKLYYDLDLDSIDNPDYQAARKRYRATADELTATRSGETRALAKARRAVLAELRPMGGEAPQLPWKDPDKHMSTLAGIGGQVATWKGAPLIGDDIDEDLRARIDNAMRAAHETYPADWNERLAASDAAPKQTMVVARGFAGTDGTLALSFEKAPWEGAPEELQVATHELGHFMERAVDGLKTMEWAYHWKRTTTKRKGGRTREGKNALTPIYGGDEDEVGSQDRFANHYVGKVYRDGPEAAWELFTTASESLFAGSPYVDGDEETAAWALGVLATL